MSDKEIVERGGILDLPLDDDEGVMADKGFTIEGILPLGISLNILPFLGHYDQMHQKMQLKRKLSLLYEFMLNEPSAKSTTE